MWILYIYIYIEIDSIYVVLYAKMCLYCIDRYIYICIYAYKYQNHDIMYARGRYLRHYRHPAVVLHGRAPADGSNG